MPLTRRTLLGAGAAVGVLAATGLPAFADQKVNPVTAGTPFGPLVEGDDHLALPEGFSARRVVSVGVEELLDGPGGSVVGRTASNLDGTGCFEKGNRTFLVVNHECRATASGPVPHVQGTVYDRAGGAPMGGNSVVEVTRDGTFVQQWVGLSGTIRNCAGGETPWGSWLSCEEDTTRKGATVKTVAGVAYKAEQDHGYVFEVFPAAPSEQIPVPIKAWGRAVWEGAAIGPQRKDAYLTEDTGGGLFYRWTAPAGKVIKPGIALQFGENDGVLQAAQLVKNGTPLVHYGQLTASDLDKAYPVTWVDGGADRQAQDSNLRAQFPGATVHSKIEGCWSDRKGLWIAVSYTNGAQLTAYPTLGMTGDSGLVLFYDYKAQTLTLKEYYANGNPQGFHGPDNITVSPFGTLVISEDGNDPCSLISWTPQGGSEEFARDLGGRGEWAGPVFSDSGDVLFASIQSTATYAITGPFRKHLGSN